MYILFVDIREQCKRKLLKQINKTTTTDEIQKLFFLKCKHDLEVHLLCMACPPPKKEFVALIHLTVFEKQLFADDDETHAVTLARLVIRNR